MVAHEAPIKVCPQCGHSLAADGVRCGYCFAEVSTVPVLEGEDAARYRERAQAGVAERPRVWTRGRILRLAVFGVVLAVLGWWVYGRFFAGPDPLPLPASRTLSVAGGGPRWPAANGDRAATRSTTAPAVLTAEPTWTAHLGAEMQVPPVADERHLYVGLTDDRLVALRVEDGIVAWTYQAPHRIWSPPAVAGDLLYLTLRRGEVLALDAATGSVRWQTPVDGSFFAPPTVVEGLLLAVAEEAMFGLEADTGRLLWRVDIDARTVTLAPVVFEEQIMVATAGNIQIFGRETGELRFRFPQLQPVGLVADNGQVLGVSARFVSALDPGASHPWWERFRGVRNQFWVWGITSPPPPPESRWIAVTTGDLGRRVFAPALGAGRIVVADEVGHVRAYDTATGTLRWEIEAGPVAGPPTLAGNGLLLPGVDNLALRRAEDGSELTRIELPALPPDATRDALVTDEGTFVVDQTGEVRAWRNAP